MRDALQDEPLRAERRARDGAPMRDLGDLHAPRPIQDRARAHQCRSPWRSAELLRGADQLEGTGEYPLTLGMLFIPH